MKKERVAASSLFSGPDETILTDKKRSLMIYARPSTLQK
jgi:hypothetical protein